eukprot:NODE_128_length_17019_cov_0.764480.p4 type:complete len:443 gc:universal NODE_128_length_17019_cov_0.764480:14545-15873(+)
MDVSKILFDLNSRSSNPIILEGFDTEGLFAQLESNYGEICRPIRKVVFESNVNVNLTEDDIDQDQKRDAEEIVSLENQEKSIESDSVDSDIYEGADDEFFSMKEMKKFVESQEHEDERSFDNSEESETEIAEDVDYDNIKFDDFFEDQPDLRNNTKHSKEQEQIREKILELEKAKLLNYLPESKPFALKGEVSARDRERDDLLEIDIEHDTVKKPMPATQNISLDNLIRDRVENMVFDNIQRKQDVDTTHIQDSSTLVEKKKKFNIEEHTSKSKKTLAQLYEEEYLQKQQDDLFGSAVGKERPKEHIEIESLWSKVEEQLNMLSNSFYRPKAYSSEISAEQPHNIITKEDIQPAAINEMISEKPKEIVAFKEYSEMNQQERQAHRRKNKLYKKKTAAKRQLIDRVINASKPKVLKQKKQDVLTQLMRDSKISIADQKGKIVK